MMTNEQQLFWSYFKWNPSLFAVSEAEAIRMLPQEKQQQRIDRAFDRLLNEETDPMILARVVKTWLSKYQLQLEPEKVTRFDEFHQRILHITRSSQVASLRDILDFG